MKTEAQSSPDDGSLRRAARGSVVNLVGTAVAAAATFSLAVLITRLSTPAQAGLFFSATSLFLIAINVGRLGTNTGLVYFISGSRGRGEEGLAASYMRLAAGPVAVVAVLTSLVVLLGADVLASWLSPERPDAFALSLRWMALFVPVAAVANLATAGTQGLGTMKVFALVDQILMPVLQLVLVTAILLVGPAWGAPTAWAAAYLPVAVVSWLWWRRLVSRLDPAVPRTARTSSKTFWKFTAPRAMASVSQIAMQRLDIVLVGALASLGAAAVYAAATRFLVLGQMAGRAISLSIQPLLGGALARRDIDEARRLYQTCTAWLIMGTWPLYLLLINFASEVLAIFGDDYRAGSAALVLLCSVMLFATACGTVDIVLNMAGKSLWNLVNVLVALAVFVGLDLWLIPRLGFMGAAIGWAAAIVVANLLPLLQIRHTPGLHPFGRASLMTMATNVFCFGFLPWAGTLAGLLGAGAGVAAGVLVYGAFLYRARSSLELKTLTQVLRRRKGRRLVTPPEGGGVLRQPPGTTGPRT